jgi:hypothetical protein
VRDAAFYASGLLDLTKQTAESERRASWRQAMAALAQAASDDGPGPLEALHPAALSAGVRVALQSGLADDLDWLTPAAAGAALYELASALPVGAEQRELGRRVLARLLSADAVTFAGIARRMALAGGRGLASRAMRARVALVVELPLWLGIADGPLALALASRRELAREWIGLPSTGSLPARRLAARLIERAAQEAALRAARGDEHSLRVFTGESLTPAWERLLADREPLVWRHVAVARGLLAPWIAPFDAAVAASVAPGLSPTEWRRAATSLAAMVGVSPDRALQRIHDALTQGLLKRDPGAASAFVWGLARSVDVEPGAAARVLDRVIDGASLEIGEAVMELRAELGDSPVVQRASAGALALLSNRPSHTEDDGAEALALEVARGLAVEAGRDEPVRAQIAAALRAFATDGAEQARRLARGALTAARASIDALEAVSVHDEGAETPEGVIARRTTIAALRDLDVSLLGNDALADLLSLSGGETARAIDDTLDGLRERMGEWILAREGAPLPTYGGEGVVPAHPTLSMRRLRALLHLVDRDMGEDETDPARATRLRKRCMRITSALRDRFERGAPSPVRRTIVAALARALDALVRVGTCEPIDALLVVCRQVTNPVELETLSEASMDPELVHMFHRYALFADAVAKDASSALPAYDELTRDLALDDSSRSEALRTVLVRLGSALSAIVGAPSLRALAGSSTGEPEVVSALESALGALAQLAVGARGRLDPERATPIPSAPPRPLSVAIARVLAGSEPSLAEHAVAASLDALLAGVPGAIGKLVAAIVWRLSELPKEGVRPDSTIPRVTELLPEWLLQRRTIGGFYVLRALSAGGAGSVFVAVRAEERSQEGAERFALKIPEYSATAARSLAEAEFLKMFREEAATLMALPQHPNLARCVTYDGACKPKPILVMELVEGATLERLIEARGLTAAKALQFLDDVLCGLEAMHAVDIGHLDLKPSNVVLRRGKQAVVVDFGLAGRRLRPGCATGPYGAPEVWGALELSREPPPSKADIYAFGCLVYEALTARVLFDAETETQQIAMHLVHDGSPAPLRALANRSGLAPLAELLSTTLRRDALQRPNASDVRKGLARLTPALARMGWPIDVGS